MAWTHKENGRGWSAYEDSTRGTRRLQESRTPQTKVAGRVDWWPGKEWSEKLEEKNPGQGATRRETNEEAKAHLELLSCWWMNVEIYGRARQATDDNIIRRMRTTCWTTNATNTHSEYVPTKVCPPICVEILSYTLRM